MEMPWACVMDSVSSSLSNRLFLFCLSACSDMQPLPPKEQRLTIFFQSSPLCFKGMRASRQKRLWHWANWQQKRWGEALFFPPVFKLSSALVPFCPLPASTLPPSEHPSIKHVSVPEGDRLSVQCGCELPQTERQHADPTYQVGTPRQGGWKVPPHTHIVGYLDIDAAHTHISLIVFSRKPYLEHMLLIRDAKFHTHTHTLWFQLYHCDDKLWGRLGARSHNTLCYSRDCLCAYTLWAEAGSRPGQRLGRWIWKNKKIRNAVRGNAFAFQMYANEHGFVATQTDEPPQLPTLVNVRSYSFKAFRGILSHGKLI